MNVDVVYSEKLWIKIVLCAKNAGSLLGMFRYKEHWYRNISESFLSMSVPKKNFDRNSNRSPECVNSLPATRGGHVNEDECENFVIETKSKTNGIFKTKNEKTKEKFFYRNFPLILLTKLSLIIAKSYYRCYNSY